jgi:hypothetical protein
LDQRRWRPSRIIIAIASCSTGETKGRTVYVEISGSISACEPAMLPHPMSEDVATKRRSAVKRYVAEGDPPHTIVVCSNGTSAPVRQSFAVI